ncbi:MAG: DUF6498-containing protein [Chitinophagales bacterium]|nr:DUF6498-containing protein [Chitinophagales bacterium]
MKFIYKKSLNSSDYFLIAINLIPIWGVWFLNWDAKMIFIVYCLESLIAGFYTIIKIWITFLFSKNQKENGANISIKKTILKALFFTGFFCFHFGLFVFVQLSIFLGVIEFGSKETISVFQLLFHLPKYIPFYAQLLLLSFFISYGLDLLKNFIANDKYKNASIAMVMMSPYKRIFIQQFLVIFGAFSLLFDKDGKILIIIFVFLKIIADVFIDYKLSLKALSKD